MKAKNKIRFLNELIKSVDNPKEFIYGIMALQNQNAGDVAEKAQISQEHFYVAMNQVINGQGLGVRLCVQISRGLDIDPFYLNRVVSDYKLRKYLEETSTI